jgi:hypothetical protein
MSARRFLVWGGGLLLVLGTIGLPPVFTKANTPWFWLDGGENAAHTVLGLFSLAAAYGLNDVRLEKWIVASLGVAALFFGVYGFLVMSTPEPNTFGLTNLESPVENVMHLALGAWAIYAAFLGRHNTISPAT